MSHEFDDAILKAHFAKTPMPQGSCDLLDLPQGVFLDTEEEINVIAAILWILCVDYDTTPRETRPSNREDVRKWIVKHRRDALPRIAHRIEPPFTAWSIDQIQKDVGAMMEELLLKTLPAETKK